MVAERGEGQRGAEQSKMGMVSERALCRARVGVDFVREEMKRTAGLTSCGNLFQLGRQMESVSEGRKREKKREAQLVSAKAPDRMLRGPSPLLEI